MLRKYHKLRPVMGMLTFEYELSLNMGTTWDPVLMHMIVVRTKKLITIIDVIIHRVFLQVCFHANISWQIQTAIRMKWILFTEVQIQAISSTCFINRTFLSCMIDFCFFSSPKQTGIAGKWNVSGTRCIPEGEIYPPIYNRMVEGIYCHATV